MGNKDFVLVTKQIFFLSVTNVDSLIYTFVYIPIITYFEIILLHLASLFEHKLGFYSHNYNYYLLRSTISRGFSIGF